jgi:DNA ligase D-like protein (predicted ligase)
MSGVGNGGPPGSRAKFIEPMLAAPGSEVAGRAGGPLQAGPGTWLLEPKLDGLRCLAVRNGGEVSLWSRNRRPFNERFPGLVKELLCLPAQNFVLDGEIVVVVGGRPDFSALQEGGAGDVQYSVFDVLWLLGEDLRHLPIEERKDLLQRAVPETRSLKTVLPLEGEPRALLEKACHDGWEGLVAKRSGSAYRDGRSADWLKLKCACRQELVVAGFTAPKGARAGFGALLLGYWAEGRLVYAGKVGTGFSEAVLRKTLAKLEELERPTSPFSAPVGEKDARWAEPVLVAEVAFTNWTPDGRLRHPSFLGLRTDKPSADVVREECVPLAGVLGLLAGQRAR